MNKVEAKKILKDKLHDNYKNGEIRSGSMGPMTSFPEIVRRHIEEKRSYVEKIARENNFPAFTLIENWKQTYHNSEGYDPAYRTCWLKIVWVK